MAEYLIEATKAPETTADQIAIQIDISRDGDLIATWIVRFSPTVSDTNIRAEIIRRIQEFIKVDTGAIAAELVDARAEAIAATIDGHIETV